VAVAGRPPHPALVGGALKAAGAERVVVVIPPGDEPVAREILADLDGWISAPGGAVRANRCCQDWPALADRPGDEAVLIHDAARPFVNAGHVRACWRPWPGRTARFPPCPSPTRSSAAEGGRDGDHGFA